MEVNIDEINLYHADINSMSIVNNNLYLTDKQLGQIAKQIFDWWFQFVPDNNYPRHYFIIQINALKDLLVDYRTEQVVAGLEYWTLINPPKKPVTSVRYLKFVTKGKPNIMIALDFYKKEYLESPSSPNIKRVDKEKEEIVSAEEKKKVDAMSSDDFVSMFLDGLGKINIEKG